MKKIFVMSFLLAIGTPSAGMAEGVVVFGDSYSDTGNLVSINPDAAALVNALPIYDNGSFTDDGVPVVEALQDAGYSVSTSYHLIGAPVGNNFAIGSGRLVTDTAALSMETQVSAFLTSQQSPDLAVVWIGLNDIRDATRLESWQAGYQHVRAAAKTLENQLMRIAEDGRVDKILLLGAFDAATLPEVPLLEAAYPGIANKAAQFSKAFNTAARGIAEQVRRRTSVDILYLPIGGAAKRILRNSALYGYAAGDAYCLALFIDAPGTPSQYCANGIDLTAIPFVDEVHPSSSLNERLEHYLETFIPVP